MTDILESRSAPPRPRPSLADRFAAFVVERFPFAAELARHAFAAALVGEAGGARDASGPDDDAARLYSLRPRLADELARRLGPDRLLAGGAAAALPETTPGTAAVDRLAAAARELAEACDGFLAREAVVASLDAAEKREMLRGMVLTRAVDNRLKAFFTGSEVRWRGKPFQGKGFRSLGQEAIYAAALRLRRGAAWRGDDGSWHGDVVAPVIRDAGVALAMRGSGASAAVDGGTAVDGGPTDGGGLDEMAFQLLNAQMGKDGPPMHGRDLHIGDFSWGVLPPSAPLAISTASVAGLAMAFQQQDEPGDTRVAVSFIGEGGTSLGEWHEAINLCAARRLPAVFCVQNNQTALSTPVGEQSAVRCFADKAAGYGVPGITVDGTDPEAIAAAFAWAADRARAGGGPALVELVAMRMCGHAHHDDMLYLGRDPQPGWDYPELSAGAYADEELYRFWAARDPIATYAAKLAADGVIGDGDLAAMRREEEARVEAAARRVIEAPWPDAAGAGEGVYTAAPAAVHAEVLTERPPPRLERFPALPDVEPGLPFTRDGRTLLEAVMLGVGDALAADPRVFVYGEDVGGRYGNAFLLLRPLLAEHAARLVNAPISEAGILGVCVGAALAGQRPIGEIQFNDFVATGFNQLVNNAAKVHYRWGASVPMVVRMPWGGLRHAGPYHSQNTEAWFYRTPGLKIVVPSTPEDARALLAAAVADPDPVLFYEHIALYRDPSIKQALPDAAPRPLPLGRAALRRAGSDLALISYGAYVHLATRVAERLAADGIEAAVLDLRSLAPLDRTRASRRRPPLRQGADRPRGQPHRRHRREPGGDHPGGGVRVPGRAGAHRRRARHAGALLAAARSRVPARRATHRARRPPAGGVLRKPHGRAPAGLLRARRPRRAGALSGAVRRARRSARRPPRLGSRRARAGRGAGPPPALPALRRRRDPAAGRPQPLPGPPGGALRAQPGAARRGARRRLRRALLPLPPRRRDRGRRARRHRARGAAGRAALLAPVDPHLHAAVGGEAARGGRRAPVRSGPRRGDRLLRRPARRARAPSPRSRGARQPALPRHRRRPHHPPAAALSGRPLPRRRDRGQPALPARRRGRLGGAVRRPGRHLRRGRRRRPAVTDAHSALFWSYDPEVPSFRHRLRPVAEELERRGWHCTIARLPKGRYGRRIAERGEAVAGADLVVLAKMNLGFGEPRRLRRLARAVTLDLDDAIYLRQPRRPGEPPNVSCIRLARFGRSCEICDLVTAGNARLAAMAQRWTGHVEIVPTTVELPPAPPDPAARRGRTLVWIGRPENLPYLEALRPALGRLLRIYPDLRLRVVCSAWPEWPEVPVERMRWSPATEAESLATAGIGVMPLSDDAWARGKCSFKLLQYMAQGLACVASPVGTNVEVVRDGVTGLLAATGDEWEGALRRLLADEGLRRAMGRAGWEWARGWERGRHVRRHADLYAGLVDEGRGPRRVV